MNQNLSNFFKKYDYSFFGGMFIIFLIGILNLYSATHADTSLTMKNLYKSQSLWFLISIVVGFLVSLVNPKTVFHIYFTLLILFY